MYKDEFLCNSKILILIAYEECETIVNNKYYMLWSRVIITLYIYQDYRKIKEEYVDYVY